MFLVFIFFSLVAKYKIYNRILPDTNIMYSSISNYSRARLQLTFTSGGQFSVCKLETLRTRTGTRTGTRTSQRSWCGLHVVAARRRASRSHYAVPQQVCDGPADGRWGSTFDARALGVWVLDWAHPAGEPPWVCPLCLQEACCLNHEEKKSQTTCLWCFISILMYTRYPFT